MSMQDEQQIERYIELNPHKPWLAEAWLKDYGIAVWALVGHLGAVDGDVDRVAADYEVPRAVVEAALAYYRRHKSLIDARLAANSTDEVPITGTLASTMQLYVAAYYTDHNVAVGVAHLLRAEGHNVVTARDLGLDHARDDEHLLVAAQQARIFISHNRADFELLHHAWHHWSRAWGVTVPHAGILIMPQTLPPFHLAQEVNAIQKTGVSFVNALYEWRSSSGWTRR